MITHPDSPLRKIPTQLNDRQRLFVDGIRYSIDMAALAYYRVCTGAHHINQKPLGDPRAVDQAVFTAMFLDAWSMVDAVQRLRTLIREMPGLRKSPEKRLFLEKTSALEDLRNAVQHIYGTYREETTSAPWGSLSWAASIDSASLRVYVMIGGAMAAASHPAVNPVGRPFRPPVDLVYLTGYGITVSLSDVIDTVKEYALYFEDRWSKFLVTHSALRPSDTIIALDFSVGDEAQEGASI